LWNEVYQQTSSLGEGWQEQAAVISLWEKRQDEYKSHIKVVEARVLQSSAPGHFGSDYHDGDFLAHFAGGFCNPIPQCRSTASQLSQTADQSRQKILEMRKNGSP